MTFAAVTAYERYLARAKEVVSGAPFWKSVDNEDFAQLSVDGAEATLSWLDISSGYYGGYETDRESVSFPATLLAMPEDAFKKWKAEQRAEYDRTQEEAARAAAARQTAAAKAQAEAILTHGVVVDGNAYKLVPKD